MSIKCLVTLDGKQICEFNEETMDRTEHIKTERRIVNLFIEE